MKELVSGEYCNMTKVQSTLKIDKMNEYYVFEDGCWKHKTKLKLIVNPVLRKLQFWTNKPYVICSITDFEFPESNLTSKPSAVPIFRKYGFKPIRYFRK